MLRFIHRHYRSCVVLVSLFWFGCYFAFDLGLAALALLDCGCLALLFVLASLYLRRVTRTYSEACDPEPYLELGLWGVRRFQNARTARGKRALETYRLCAVSALSALGRYEEALGYLDAVDPSRLPLSSCVVYWHDRFSTLLHLDRPPEELAGLLRTARSCLDSAHKLPPSQKRTAELALSYDRILLSLRENGPSREAVAQLEQHLSAVTTELHRVHCHFHLSTSLLALGDAPAAQEHLDYVIAHGNKLYVRTQAMELLDKLEPKEATPC